MKDVDGNILGLVDSLRHWLGYDFGTILAIVVIAALALLVTRIACAATRKLLAKDGVPLPSASIFTNVIRFLGFVLGAGAVLQACFNVNVSALLAALGVGGIAISLGFQDTIANFFGGLMISIMRIVEPGDNVRIGSDVGVVRDITWRHTTIETPEGETVIVPNALLSKASVTRLAPRELLVVPFSVTCGGMALDALGKRLETVATDAAAQAGELASPATVRFTGLTESAYDGKIRVLMADFDDLLEAQDNIVRAIAPYVSRDPDAPAAPTSPDAGAHEG